jgi:hypothetical protein
LIFWNQNQNWKLLRTGPGTGFPVLFTCATRTGTEIFEVKLQPELNQRFTGTYSWFQLGCPEPELKTFKNWTWNCVPDSIYVWNLDPEPRFLRKKLYMYGTRTRTAIFEKQLHIYGTRTGTETFEKNYNWSTQNSRSKEWSIVQILI